MIKILGESSGSSDLKKAVQEFFSNSGDAYVDVAADPGDYDFAATDKELEDGDAMASLETYDRISKYVIGKPVTGKGVIVINNEGEADPDYDFSEGDDHDAFGFVQSKLWPDGATEEDVTPDSYSENDPRFTAINGPFGKVVNFSDSGYGELWLTEETAKKLIASL
jgi:hypothetical protein